MKLVSVRIDPDHIRLAADHVSAELFEWIASKVSYLKLTDRFFIIQHQKGNWCR